ncbi:uncharacterized protein METZ01_LOCUS224978 [marine metagenome]|uniref:Uncharacterized protein n=1 Tax=marine metagenome TaxID=408172 RepID=A0A382GBW4_9ZZZZ
MAILKTTSIGVGILIYNAASQTQQDIPVL